LGWEPASELQLRALIAEAEARMTPAQLKLWQAIRIEPAKWAEATYGEAGNGFWAVALIGKTVVWYNDIEEGFNTSQYSRFGSIDDYWCNQDELEDTLQQVLEMIATGDDTTPRAGPPRAPSA
jgi:hypothetical protein